MINMYIYLNVSIIWIQYATIKKEIKRGVQLYVYKTHFPAPANPRKFRWLVKPVKNLRHHQDPGCMSHSWDEENTVKTSGVWFGWDGLGLQYQIDTGNYAVSRENIGIRATQMYYFCLRRSTLVCTFHYNARDSEFEPRSGERQTFVLIILWFWPPHLILVVIKWVSVNVHFPTTTKSIDFML